MDTSHMFYAAGAVLVCLILIGVLVKKFQKSSDTPIADTFDHDEDYGQSYGVYSESRPKITDQINGVSAYGTGSDAVVPPSALKPMYEGSTPTNVGTADVPNVSVKKPAKKTVRKTSNRKSGTKKKTTKK